MLLYMSTVRAHAVQINDYSISVIYETTVVILEEAT